MKALNLIFCLLFILSAALQYNDPDPYIWIPIYLYGAALCWLAFNGKYYPVLYVIGIFIYSIYAVYLLFSEHGVLDWIMEHDAESITGSMKAEKPWIEGAREFFGLLILLAIMIIDFFYVRKQLKLLAEQWNK
jgi:hypothetical protein